MRRSGIDTLPPGPALQPRTLKIFAALLAGYALLAISAYRGSSDLEPMSGYVVMVPLLSIYLFHKPGIPGLPGHDGACGWGWCAPTTSGRAFLVLEGCGQVPTLAQTRRVADAMRALPHRHEA